jgi:chemotaxis protein histidine kinase CheA
MTTDTKTETKVEQQGKKEPATAKQTLEKKTSATKKPPITPTAKETPKKTQPTTTSKEPESLDAKVPSLVERLSILEQQIAKINETLTTLSESKAKGTSKSGGRIGGQKVLDTKTNKVYGSLSKAGKELASEINADPTDRFVFYKIEKAFPERFQRVS